MKVSICHEQANHLRSHLDCNCGKVYTLTLRQSTQALKDKLKEGNDWEDIAAKYDPIQLIILPMVQWIQLFLLAQGVKINRNIIYQDNKSAVLLEENGKKSSGKRTRHLNIRYFLVTDAVARKDCEIEWIPRERMYADYITNAQSRVFYS